jgi:putative flippase GtrA
MDDTDAVYKPAESEMRLPPPESRRSFKALAAWAWDSWATRSLAMSSAATVVDISVLVFCVELLGLPNPVAAMVGVTFGSAFTFFANRHFAFRDHHPDLAPQVMKFVLTTAVAMVIHASLVYIFADRLRIPVVFAKIIADIIVFSVGQLLVMRYFIFPKKRTAGATAAPDVGLAPRAADGQISK